MEKMCKKFGAKILKDVSKKTSALIQGSKVVGMYGKRSNKQIDDTNNSRTAR
jgi:hypothetical protein